MRVHRWGLACMTTPSILFLFVTSYFCQKILRWTVSCSSDLSSVHKAEEEKLTELLKSCPRRLRSSSLVSFLISFGFMTCLAFSKLHISVSSLFCYQHVATTFNCMLYILSNKVKTNQVFLLFKCSETYTEFWLHCLHYQCIAFSA